MYAIKSMKYTVVQINYSTAVAACHFSECTMYRIVVNLLREIKILKYNSDEQIRFEII